MPRSLLRTAAPLALLLFLPAPAFAHTGGALGGLGAGLAHPLTGLDHLLVMLAVGALAVRLGGGASRLLPACFVGSMLVGAALGAGGLALPGVEVLIALSVGAAGLALAAGRVPGVTLAAASSAAFALFHGHAHGAELAAGASAWSWGAGMAATSAALLLAGGWVVRAAHRMAGPRAEALVRVGGGAVAAAGAVLVLVAL